MKVLMISKDAKIFDANSAVYMRAVEYAGLFAQLHIVILAKSSNPKYLSTENNLFIYNTTSRFKIIFFLKTLWVSMRIARSFKKDDWITSQDPFESGIIALVVSKLSGLKLQLQLHTDCFNSNFIRHNISNRLRTLLARLILPSADAIRVVSEQIKNSIPNLKVVHVLPIFVDIPKIKNSDITYDLHKKYPEFQKIILIVGRLEKEKNFTLALTVFQKMRRKNQNLGFVIVGSGSEEVWLKEFARHLGIEGKVRFEGWLSDTISAYKSADLLLVTSLYEGYGMNIVEALACGCPVVSTDVGIAHDAGARVVSYDAGEIALKALDILDKNTKGILNQDLDFSKEDYLESYKKTFS